MSKRKKTGMMSSQGDLALENQQLRLENEKLLEELNTLRAELVKRDDPVAPPLPPPIAKTFTMKHTFENMAKYDHRCPRISHRENHYGVWWRMHVKREADHLSFSLSCQDPANDDELRWSMETEFLLTFKSARTFDHTESFLHTYGNGSDDTGDDIRGNDKFLTWDVVKNDFLTSDGKLIAEVQVTIKQTKGLYLWRMRSFDISMEDLSDVVLVVNYEKFYVSKLTLAAQSPYFKAAFLGGFQESQKKEITLPGLDAADFQKYLEVIYGEESIEEASVEGTLLVADMFDTETVRKKCENFLIDYSSKPSRKKLELSARYGLENLKNNCISRITNVSGIEALIPNNILDMDHSIMATVLQKTISMLKERLRNYQ